MLSKTHTKYIQSLQDKKFRDETGEFVAEGSKTVYELLQTNVFPCKQLFATRSWLNRHRDALDEGLQEKLVALEDFELEKISGLQHPQDVLAIFGKREPAEPGTLSGKIALVLDDLQDPGNFGTVIRTADWFGVEHIICSPFTVDLYNPKVVQATMGSLGRVNVLYTDLPAWLSSQTAIRKYAATLKGSEMAKLRGRGEGILIIGNEGRGISDAVLKLADEQITIPKKGRAESLNAAVAAGILLSVFSS